MMMFNIASASSLFNTRKQLDNMDGKLQWNSYTVGNDIYVPLYEGKMSWFYNHHYAEFPNEYDVYRRPSTTSNTPTDTLTDSKSPVKPWHWVKKSLVDNRLPGTNKDGNIRWQWTHSFYIAFRGI